MLDMLRPGSKNAGGGDVCYTAGIATIMNYEGAMPAAELRKFGVQSAVTANQALVVFLVVFWGGLAAAIKIANWRAGKRWSDGPSLFPVIPFLPVLGGALGWVINWVASPWGSWGISAAHLGLLAVASVSEFRHRHRRDTEDA